LYYKIEVRFSPGDFKVPNHKSYKKSLRQEAKANAVNRSVRSAIRTSLKTIRTASTKEEALQEMPRLFSMLDKAAAKGRAGFTKNAASNYKAKVAKVVNAF
jgi:small subunit ribosomal protein S20